MRLCFTLFVILCMHVFLNLAYAVSNTGVNADQRKSQSSMVKIDDRRKRKTVKLQKKTDTIEEEHLSTLQVQSDVLQSRRAIARKTFADNDAISAGKNNIVSVKVRESDMITATSHRESAHLVQDLSLEKGTKGLYGSHRGTRVEPGTIDADSQPFHISESHQVRYQHAKYKAIATLMSQMGKPYRWGGKSPATGFDCSGLIYYAYKDLIRVPLPRTANEMYHLRHAEPVKKSKLESGDLVFFRIRIRNRGTVDHVGVYLGNGRFIQSPRTGRDIHISYLSKEYWQNHYVGARRVMTPTTIR